MPIELSIPAVIALLTALPFVAGYWVARAVARVRLGRRLREARAWPGRELAPAVLAWLEPGWDAAQLPQQLSLSALACDWAAADPEILRDWRLGRVALAGSIADALRALWNQLPAAARDRTEARLRTTLGALDTAWAGAARGWTCYPYLLPAPEGKRSERGLPIEIEPDLTSAPAPGPFRARAAGAEAPGWLLPLLLALQRRSPVHRLHPLAAGARELPGIGDLGGRLGGDVGRQVGARVGGMLGPIGATVGGYVGGMLGSNSARKLAGNLKEREPALDAVEEALVRLGKSASAEALESAVRLPEEWWLATGTEWETHRAQRRGGLRERLWPSAGQALGEECLRAALSALRGYRRAAPLFLNAALNAGPAARGGIVLQNPWLAARLPGGPAAIAAARAALNRAARTLEAGPERGQLPGKGQVSR